MTLKEDQCRCKTHGKASCIIHWINPNHPDTPTPKEGPPTLREWRYLAQCLANTALRCPWCGEDGSDEFHKPNCTLILYANVTDEALELDEKRRAALEELLSHAKKLRPMILLNTIHGEKRVGLDVTSQYAEPMKGIADSVDALTPDPKDEP